MDTMFRNNFTMQEHEGPERKMSVVKFVLTQSVTNSAGLIILTPVLFNLKRETSFFKVDVIYDRQDANRQNQNLVVRSYLSVFRTLLIFQFIYTR